MSQRRFAPVSIGGTGPAAEPAAKLGKPARLLIGLGQQGSIDPIPVIESQSLTTDIFERYLVGVGAGDWTTWNSPTGQYLDIVAREADAIGALPMFTLYQIDGNPSIITNQTVMPSYWANVRLMFRLIAAYGKPTLVNLEPDLWGFIENSGGAGGLAYVNTNPDCAALPNTAAGMAQCLISMARQYAPNAYIGFPPAGWNGGYAHDVSFMSAIGAQNADFIVAQTQDMDAGCDEPHPYSANDPGACHPNGGGTPYWDETNQTHPNFQDHFADLSAYRSGIGNNLPVIWWQTPEGVPSATSGGVAYHYRDDRVDYFLKHPSQLTAIGGLAVVFNGGQNQTNITTDGGQFQALDSTYMAAPAALP